MSQSRGLPLHLSEGDVSRWESKIVVTGSCWIWMGAIGSDGYGRFSMRDSARHERVVTPHQIAARRAFGPIPLGSTLMHDCDVRICVSAGAGHLRVATQAENMAQAARRGRAAGPRPGLVDVRGPAGASRAVQIAIRAAGDVGPELLAAVLSKTLAEGDPWRRFEPLFELPARRVEDRWDVFPDDLFDPRAAGEAKPPAVETDPLFPW